jgi:hypothetical protein
VFLYFLSGCNRPTLTGIDLDEIDLSQDPIQKSCTSDKPIVKECKSGRFEMTPLAEYKISGVVVGKGSYSSGWDGELSPVDLAVAWGKLAEPENGKYVTYSQGYRWYHYLWKEGGPVDPSYIASHSSNNHIIPANENIRRAIKTIKRKDRIVLKGFLVNLRGGSKGRAVTWNTVCPGRTQAMAPVNSFMSPMSELIQRSTNSIYGTRGRKWGQIFILDFSMPF